MNYLNFSVRTAFDIFLFRVQGTRYFTAMQNYGGFCRANVILTGDYPAEDEGDDLDEEL